MKKVIFLSILALFSSQTYAQPQKVKVLAILPLSGEIASIGVAVKNGMTMASEKSDFIKLDFEDDAGIPKNTVSALQKHLATEKPFAVVCASSGTCKSISPVTEKAQIPLIAIATDKEVSANKKYAVNLWVTPDIEVIELAKEAHKRGYQKIAIFSTIHEGPLSIKRTFLHTNQDHLEIVYNEEVSPDLKDFKSIITKFKSQTKNNEPDAIFLNIFFGQVGIFARQLRELGVKKDLFSIELFEDENEVKVSQGALLNQWYVQAEDAHGSFLDEYSKKYSTASSFGAANGYDSVMLLNTGIKEGKENPEQINHYLHTVVKFSGACGIYSATGDNRFTLPATVKVVTKDGFKKVHSRN